MPVAILLWFFCTKKDFFKNEICNLKLFNKPYNIIDEKNVFDKYKKILHWLSKLANF